MPKTTRRMMMPNYTHDTERWRRSNAELYRRKGNQQMARNFELCAEDVKRLRTENEQLRRDDAALKEAVSHVVARAQTIMGVRAYAVPNAQLDALAALVGKE